MGIFMFSPIPFSSWAPDELEPMYGRTILISRWRDTASLSAFVRWAIRKIEGLDSPSQYLQDNANDLLFLRRSLHHLNTSKHRRMKELSFVFT